MKSRYPPWAKEEQTSKVIDLNKFVNDHRTSSGQEVTLSGQP